MGKGLLGFSPLSQELAIQIIPLESHAYDEELQTIWEAAVRATHDFLQEEDIQFYKKYVERMLQNPPLLLGLFIPSERAQGTLVAFMGIQDDMLEMLFVHPAYMGKGFGSALLQCAFDGFNVWRLTVNEQNPQAYRFYKKHGFTRVSRSERDDAGKPFPILYLEKR